MISVSVPVSGRRTHVGSEPMTLAWLLRDPIEASIGDPAVGELAVTGVASDSRLVQPGDLFLALPGRRRHGLAFYRAVREAGAVAVVYPADNAGDGDGDGDGDGGRPRRAERGRAASALAAARAQWADRSGGGPDCPLIAVAELPRRAALIVDRCYRHPAERLRLVGVTGTDGKTSCAGFIAQALRRLAAPAPCALLGTLGYGLAGEPLTAGPDGALTTPDAVTLRYWLAEAVAAGAGHAVMEVSSHALDQRRSDGLPFAVAVLTQLSRDHLDYHGSVAAYAEAKRRLFVDYRPRTAVLNLDDRFGRELAAQLGADRDRRVIGYGLGSPEAGSVSGPGATPYLHGERLELRADGLRLRVRCPAGGAGDIAAPLYGRFNASNLLATLATLLALDLPFEAAVGAMNGLSTIPGRMEAVAGPDPRRPLAVVDFAHTPHALEQALRALREHLTAFPARGEDAGERRLWCVFGCGGDRDAGKRPLMGAAASRFADRCVLTNDNPRSEDPRRIAEQTLAGVAEADRARVRVQLDRGRAIAEALTEAGRGDIVLVAGKGHEDYQLIGAERYAFSDRETVRRALGLAA